MRENKVLFGIISFTDGDKLNYFIDPTKSNCLFRS